MSALPAARLHRPVAVVPEPVAPRPSRGARERGYVTAETAVLLPFLLVVLVLLVWVVSLGITQVRLVDAAREGARAVARGDEADLVRAAVAREAPDGSTVEVTTGDGTTTVVVRARSAPSLPVLDRLPGAPLVARAATPDEGVPDDPGPSS